VTADKLSYDQELNLSHIFYILLAVKNLFNQINGR
jgi:hypothetical protein